MKSKSRGNEALSRVNFCLFEDIDGSLMKDSQTYLWHLMLAVQSVF